MKKRKDDIIAFLGKDTEFDGKFSFTGAARIDGKFSGEIYSSGTLIVGESALIRSQINVGDAIINGEIHGEVSAEHRIEIKSRGKLFGNVQTPELVIEEGAIFRGDSNMRDVEKSDLALIPEEAEAISLLK